jgi:hypothetical protein
MREPRRSLRSGIILSAKWGRNLEGAIALPRRHLLKERLIGAQPPSLFASYQSGQERQILVCHRRLADWYFWFDNGYAVNVKGAVRK